MKSIFVFLILASAVFAGSAFPDEIAGTGLKLLSDKPAVGDFGGGTAYYATSDEVSIMILNIETLDKETWEGFKSDYEENSLAKGTASGITYYYYCENTENEMTCFSDFYMDGKYYTIDIGNSDRSEGETVQLLGKAVAAVIKTSSGNGGTGNGNGGENPVTMFCCMPIGLIMLAFAFAASRRGA